MTSSISQIREFSDNSTWEYYEDHADHYAAETVSVNMGNIYPQFEKYLPKNCSILDAGSGSGRDTKYFLGKGYRVTAFDYSPRLAAISSLLTGIQTQVRSFEDVKERQEYDGVWACASMLHLAKKDIPSNLERLAKALKVGGVIYVSFRYGDTERCYDDGRCYTDLDEDGLTAIFDQVRCLKIQEIWTSLGEDSFKGSGKWLNAIAERFGEPNNA